MPSARNSGVRITPTNNSEGRSSFNDRAKDQFDDVEFTEEEKHEFMVQWYQRRFQLWIPHEQELESVDMEEDDSEIDQDLLFELLVPVEEVLDRLVLKNIRKTALVRFFLFGLFMFVYFVTLIMQRSLSDSYSLESAIKKRIADAQGLETEVLFSDISEASHVWDWLEGGFLDLIFPGK